MKTATKAKPLALLGERRFMVIPGKGLSNFGIDWRFEHREFLTLDDARRKLAKRQKSQPNASWCIIEFYLPTESHGMLSLDDCNTVPLQIRIVGGAT